jgi:hypothetical protein
MTHRESYAAIIDFCGIRTQETKRPCTGFQEASAKVAFANPNLVSLGTESVRLFPGYLGEVDCFECPSEMSALPPKADIMGAQEF